MVKYSVDLKYKVFLKDDFIKNKEICLHSEIDCYICKKVIWYALNAWNCPLCRSCSKIIALFCNKSPLAMHYCAPAEPALVILLHMHLGNGSEQCYCHSKPPTFISPSWSDSTRSGRVRTRHLFADMLSQEKLSSYAWRKQIYKSI